MAAACECCGFIPDHKNKNGSTRVLNVDHCHKSDVFRGWLCWNCNVAIGKLGDDINGIMNAARYLKRAASTNILGECLWPT